MHIRKTNSAGCDLEKKLALPKRRPGNLLHAEFLISRNQRLHHKWLVTGHVSLITSSNAFTKQAPSSRERERAFLHLCRPSRFAPLNSTSLVIPTSYVSPDRIGIAER